MNCRVLENRVFLNPKIESMLMNNFVEVRLHTDGVVGPRKTRNLDLQSKLSSSIANPWLVVVDPATETPGMETGFQEVEGLTEFLDSAIN